MVLLQPHNNEYLALDDELTLINDLLAQTLLLGREIELPSQIKTKFLLEVQKAENLFLPKSRKCRSLEELQRMPGTRELASLRLASQLLNAQKLKKSHIDELLSTVCVTLPWYGCQAITKLYAEYNRIPIECVPLAEGQEMMACGKCYAVRYCSRGKIPFPAPSRLRKLA